MAGQKSRTGVCCLQSENPKRNTRDFLAAEVVMWRIVLAGIAAIVVARGDIFAQAGGGGPTAARCVVCRAGRPLVWRTGHSARWRAWPATSTDISARSVSGQTAGGVAARRPQRPAQSVSRRRRLGTIARRKEVGIDGQRDDRAGRQIWVVDRCGKSGAGGTTCGGANASVNPIFQFDPSGKLLKNSARGCSSAPTN